MRNALTSMLLALAGASMLLAGAPSAGGESALLPAELRAQSRTLFGTVAPVREEEVQAPAAVLGRALFWDGRLSLDGKTACASCHAREDHGADRRRFSITAKGQPTTLHSQVIFMAQDQSALRWYGDRRDGAQQAERSLTGSMGFANAADVNPLLKALGYEPMFRAAFPDQADAMTPSNYAAALQAYQKTLRTPAPFDAFLQGDDRALAPRQLAGLRRFVDSGCASCHYGPLLGGGSLQKFGQRKDYWLATGSSPADPGRYNATKLEADRYVFRVAMLRNIARTAPYFHDGSVDRLEDAVRIMAEVQLGLRLADDEVAEIVAFLGSLTGELPAHYSAPVLPR